MQNGVVMYLTCSIKMYSKRGKISAQVATIRCWLPLGSNNLYVYCSCSASIAHCLCNGPLHQASDTVNKTRAEPHGVWRVWSWGFRRARVGGVPNRFVETPNHRLDPWAGSSLVMGRLRPKSVLMNESLTRTNWPDSTFQFSFVCIVRSPRLNSQTYPLVADTDSRVAVHSLTVLSGGRLEDWDVTRASVDW